MREGVEPGGNRGQGQGIAVECGGGQISFGETGKRRLRSLIDRPKHLPYNNCESSFTPDTGGFANKPGRPAGRAGK